jgi:hypothetical protein
MERCRRRPPAKWPKARSPARMPTSPFRSPALPVLAAARKKSRSGWSGSRWPRGGEDAEAHRKALSRTKAAPPSGPRPRISRWNSCSEAAAPSAQPAWLLAAIDLVGALLEGFGEFAEGAVEHGAHQRAEDAALELVVDVEMDQAAAARPPARRSSGFPGAGTARRHSARRSGSCRASAPPGW